MRKFILLLCALLLPVSAHAQASTIEDVQGATDASPMEKAVGKVVVRPLYLSDPDGQGLNAGFTGQSTKLAARWDFEDPSPYQNKGSGATALTTTGTASIVDESVSRALSLNGSGYATASINATGMDTGRFTLSLWFKMDSGSLGSGTYDYQTLCRLNDLFGTSGDPWSAVVSVGRGSNFNSNSYISIRGARNSAFHTVYGVVPSNGSGINLTTGVFYLNFQMPRLDDGEWHHLVIAYDKQFGGVSNGGPFAVYLDGSARLNTNASVPYSAGVGPNSGGTITGKTVHFGQHSGNLANVTSYLKGGLDRIRLYGRTLSTTEIGYLMNQNADGDSAVDRTEVQAGTDPLDPIDYPGSTPAKVDDTGLVSLTKDKLRYATWDFEAIESDGKIKDLSGGNALTIGGATLDNGQGMPSISARFNGAGLLYKDGLDWGTVSNYSVSHWVRFEENSPLSNTDSRVVLWEMDGVHGTVGNKVAFAVGRDSKTGREEFSLMANNGGSSGGLFWNVGFGPQMADGNWHHVVLTRSTTSGYKLWVDGTSFGSPTRVGEYLTWETQSLSGSSKRLTLGGQRGAPFFVDHVGLQGNLDRMRVWKSELTAADVSNLYNQDYDADQIPDFIEVLDETLNPLEADTPTTSVPTWDQAGFGSAPVTANLIAHWNFESFKYSTTGRYFENQHVPANYKLVPNTGVSVGFQNALASAYAAFQGAGSMSAPLNNGLKDKSSWAMGGWLRVNKDTIWNLPGIPTPLWELTDTLSETSGMAGNYRLYAIRGGQYTQVSYCRFDKATGQNDTTNAVRWILPRSLRLDDEGWHHVMLQRTSGSSAEFQLYIDGKKLNPTFLGFGVSLANFTNGASTGRVTELQLGSMLFAGRNCGLKGAWDRFRVYNASLSSQTLAALYAQDADGDGVTDLNEFGVLGRSAITLIDPIPAAPATGVDLANVDIEGVAPHLNSDSALIGLWDFEGLSDRATGFVDRGSSAKPMIPGGTPSQSGIDTGVGMPSRSAFVRDGGFLSANAEHFAGVAEVTTSLWVKTEPGLLERNPQGFSLVSFEDLQPQSDANTLTLRLQKAGIYQSLMVQNFGTLRGFAEPTTNAAAWSLLDRRLDDGNWHHVVWVRTKSGSRLYVDGLVLTARLNVGNENVYMLNKPQQASSTAPKLLLGRLSARAPGFALAGHIDRVRSYRRSLTESEVKSLFLQDFDGDGYSDAYELGRFGYDPLAVPLEDTDGPGDLDSDWDDDSGISSASEPSLATGLLGQWSFEFESGPEVGDEPGSIRFPSQRPLDLPSAVARGGVQWSPQNGMPSRSLMLSRDSHIAFPGSIYGKGGSTWSASFWVKMAQDEIASQAHELESSGEKIALATFGLKRDAFPHFVAAVNGQNQLVVESNFTLTGGIPGYSKTQMASWKLPAKLDDGKWHHVVINLSGTNSEVFVDAFASPLASANAGNFSSFGAGLNGSEPYLWLGFRRNTTISPDNVPVSALPYRGFSGAMDRVRFYERKLTLTETQDLYFQDRDGDAIPDITETNNFLNALAADTVVDGDDHDGDGLSKTTEQNAGTDWRRPDSDGDWLNDSWENRWYPGSGPFKPLVSDLAIREADTDSDGLSNWQEFLFGTDPLSAHTDNDGFNDFAEFRAGSDPFINTSVPDSATHAAMTRTGVLPGGISVPAGPQGGDPSYSYNGSDATGSRYRKVSLNGRPLADEAPETEEETDKKKEELYVDAYSLGLHYDHSLIYVPLGSSELVLQANLSLSEENWSNRSGIRPHERVNSPLGACWSTNLCAYIEETAEKGGTPDTGATPDPHYSYSVIDEGGHPLKFGSYDNNTIFAYPSSLSDRKNYQHELRRQSGDTLVLRKKFGTTLIYQLVDLNQAHRANRFGESSSFILHRYYRLTKVEDRFGNQLRYAYPTEHNKTLIPKAIYDPKRPGQRITVTVKTDNPHLISSITDPRGYTHDFSYQAKPVPSGNLAGSDTADVLASVKDPMDRTIQFGYEAVRELDSSNLHNAGISSLTYHYAINLNSVTNKRGVTSLFTYEPDNDKYYMTIGSTEISAKRIYGLPRLVKTVRSAASVPPGMAGSADVEQVAEFARRQGLRWIYTPTGVRMTAGAQSTPTKDWYNEVRDGEGNVTTYAFRDVNALLADTSTHGSSISLNWLIYYLQMDIIHPDSVGTETYKFDLGSGLALKEARDICGNPTFYSYADGWGGVSIAPSSMRNLAVFARWSDPTRKVDALGRVESYGYSPNFRIMASSRNVHGTLNETVVDRLGRRTAMTVKDAAGTTLSEEAYSYGDARFPNFMTSKTVKAFSNLSGQSWEQDLITLYEADALGRLEKQAVDMNRNRMLDAGDLVTTYGHDLNNNRTFAIDPKSQQTDFTYDPLNRLSRTLYPAADGPQRDQRAEKAILYDANGNKHAEIDENGHLSFRLHDALNRVSKEVRDMDGVSNPTKTLLTNREGATYYRLDDLGVPIGPDLVTSYNYNDVSSQIFLTDRNGIVTATVRDAIQRPVSVWENWREVETEATFATSPEKRLTTFSYDKAANTGGSIFIGDGFKPTTVTRKKAVRMASGSYEDVTTTHTYDKVYRPLKETTVYEPGKSTITETSYDDVNYRETKTVAKGETYETATRTQFDGLGRPVEVINDFGRQNATTRKFYSSTGVAYKTVDPLLRESESDFDAAGRAYQIWQARSDLAPGTTGFGKVDRTTSPTDGTIGSPVTVQVFDANGNVTSVTNARQHTTVTSYDARNRKIGETMPAVDADGDPSTTATAVPTTETFYDGLGKVTSQRDPRGYVTRTFHDRASRVWFSRTNTRTGAPSDVANPTTNNAGDVVTLNTYDKVGNVLSVQDGNGNLTRNAYDALNRLTVTATDVADGNPTDPMSSGYSAAAFQAAGLSEIVVTNEYDDAGNLTQVTDGKNQKTAFRYDGLARKTRTIWDAGAPLERTEQFEFDGVVQAARVDAKGQRTEYGYDGLHRNITVTYPSRTADNRAHDFDLAGNLLSVTYPNETQRAASQTYDALNRVRTEVSNAQTHAYTYDKVGNRLTVTYQGGRYLASTYDALNRLETCTEKANSAAPTGNVTRYGYDLAGNVIRKALPNGVITTTTYDAANRKLLMEDKSATGTVISSFAYGPPSSSEPEWYDKVGNVLRVQETYADPDIKNRTVYNAYDRVYRLSDETLDESGSGGTLTVTHYAYDTANNRTEKTKRINGQLAAADDLVFTFGNGSSANTNQLTGYGPRGSAQTHTFSYDLNGNRSSHSAFGRSDAYTYDCENRLVSLNFQTGETAARRGAYTYAYDHRTRRVVRDEKFAGGTLSNVSFSGGLSVQERTEGTLTRQYIRGSDWGGGIGGILYSLDKDDVSAFNHYNSRGDVTGQTGANGAVTWQASYEAFGTRMRQDGTAAGPQKANTKDEDPTGLLNEGFRYRDLESGVFITRDPAGFVDGPNVYTYVRQNPWTSFDPDGLEGHPLNPLSEDFAIYNLVRNTGRHFKEAGHQVTKGRPVTALRVTVGVVTSTASGDIFDTKNTVAKDATGISVNGIWNSQADAQAIADDATEVTGQKTQAVKNGTHWKVGDVLQCVSETFGAINTPSLNYADTARTIAENNSTVTIEATGHSQGASVLAGGSDLVDPEINKRTSVQTFGGQYAPTGSKFKDAYAERSGKGIVGDPVPLLDPRNIPNRATGKIYKNPEKSGHGWANNYGKEGLKRAQASKK
jgi:RHS repeat-associated protein